MSTRKIHNSSDFSFEVEIKNKIRKLLKEKKGILRVSEKIGLRKTELSNILRDENRRLKLDIIKRVCEELNYPVHRLFMEKPETELEEPTIQIVTPEEGQKLLEEKGEIDNFVSVPLIEEKIAAGNPMFIENGDIEGYCVIYEKWARGRNLVCVRVKGESMHPTICDGSIVAIDLSNNEFEEGKVFAARHNDGCTVKRVFHQDEDYLILSSDNPDRINYRDMIINLKETEVTPLIGKVVWAWSKFD